MKKIGYTTGVYDLFHIGHLNILKQAKQLCDYLIVGVTTDECVKKTKNLSPVVPFEERIEIVSSIKYVDEVMPEHDTDKLKAWRELGFNIIFKGDDWKGTEKWIYLEKEFEKSGVEVVYFPYTKTTSSTKIRKITESTIIV